MQALEIVNRKKNMKQIHSCHTWCADYSNREKNRIC